MLIRDKKKKRKITENMKESQSRNIERKHMEEEGRAREGGGD